MPIFNPFSGLSLVVHLVVIGCGKTIDFVRKDNKQFKLLKKQRGIFQTNVYRLASVLIVLFLSATMFFSFAIAIKTSVREGSNEWPRQMAAKAWRSAQIGIEDGLAWRQEYYQESALSK